MEGEGARILRDTRLGLWSALKPQLQEPVSDQVARVLPVLMPELNRLQQTLGGICSELLPIGLKLRVAVEQAVSSTDPAAAETVAQLVARGIVVVERSIDAFSGGSVSGAQDVSGEVDGDDEGTSGTVRRLGDSLRAAEPHVAAALMALITSMLGGGGVGVAAADLRDRLEEALDVAEVPTSPSDSAAGVGSGGASPSVAATAARGAELSRLKQEVLAQVDALGALAQLRIETSVAGAAAELQQPLAAGLAIAATAAASSAVEQLFRVAAAGDRSGYGSAGESLRQAVWSAWQELLQAGALMLREWSDDLLVLLVSRFIEAELHDSACSAIERLPRSVAWPAHPVVRELAGAEVAASAVIAHGARVNLRPVLGKSVTALELCC